jgi:hypothetical protein
MPIADDDPTTISPHDLRAVAARCLALAMTLPPGPKADRLKLTAAENLDMAQQLERSLAW